MRTQGENLNSSSDQNKQATQFDKFELLNNHANSEIVTNWSKTHSIGFGSQIIKIFSEQQLIDVVKETRGKIRAFGSKLSYQPISKVSSQDTLIDLQLFGIVSQSENAIEVYGGTTLEFIFEYILQKQKMLDNCPGVISKQTIAGAISTGTHGQGIKQSTIADSVIQITIVDSSGNLKQISEQNQYFGAYLTSLGCLGIITRVKLALVNNKIYHCKKVNSNLDYLLNQFQQLTEDKVQTKAWWFPWTNQVQVWYMNQATKQDQQNYRANGKKLTEASQFNNSLQNTIFLVKDKMARDTKDQQNQNNNLQVLSRFEIISDVVGNIYQIMNKGIPIPQINCQIAVDLSQLKPLLLRLQQWFSDGSKSMHYPFILRPTGKSKSWLSSTYNRMSLHIGFLVYISEDGSYVKGSLDLLKQLQQIIIEFGGKPHMGKKFSPELYDFESSYQKWADFKDLIKRQDPTGKFRNDFVNKLFKMERLD